MLLHVESSAPMLPGAVVVMEQVNTYGPHRPAFAPPSACFGHRRPPARAVEHDHRPMRPRPSRRIPISPNLLRRFRKTNAPGAWPVALASRFQGTRSSRYIRSPMSSIRTDSVDSARNSFTVSGARDQCRHPRDRARDRAHDRLSAEGLQLTQLLYRLASRTPVWRRVACAAR